MEGRRIRRNSVFHVLKPQKDPAEVDLAVTNPKVVFEELPNLYPKLAGFFVIGKLE